MEKFESAPSDVNEEMNEEGESTETDEAFSESMRLTTKEQRLLDYLTEHKDRTVERRELIERVWGEGFNPMSNVIDVHIKNLRQKLEKAGHDTRIETVWGEGYRLNDKATERDKEGA